MYFSRLITPLLLFINVFLLSGAQISIKMGSMKIKTILIDHTLSAGILKIIFNPYILWGTSCYVVSLILYIYILTKINLSVASPFMSLSYALVMIFSAFLLREHVGTYQWIGVCFIVIGVSMIYILK